MTGRPVRDLTEPSAGEWDLKPWPLAFELERTLAPGSWSLIGGLMVQVHRYFAQLPPGRSTTDVDATVRLETGAVSYAEVARAMQQAGFTLVADTAYAYRFIRNDGGDVVDLMVSDRFAASRQPRYDGRLLFGVAGGTRALQDTMTVRVVVADSTLVATLSVLSLRGAFVLKGAALMNDSRNPGRHIEDGLTLLACVSDPNEVREGLSDESRRRVRALLRGVRDDRRVWSRAEPIVAELAGASMESMARIFDLDARTN